jgi:Patatin-like phospholipase
MSPAKNEGGAKDFESVRAKELEYIRLRQAGTPAALGEGDASERLIGLAFSGGGIRSATTNLGVLQALSRMGILRLVDYLSTVSGGGYIGGCLASILSVKRSDLLPADDQKNFDYASRTQLRFSTEWKEFPFRALREKPADAKPGDAFKPSDSEKIVAHLRTHGDFLIARRSIFKREALRAVGNLVAGILYTLILTVLTLAVVTLLLLGAAHTLSRDVANWDDDTGRNKVEASLADTELRYTREGSKVPEQRVREATDPVMSDHLTHRLGLIWDDMTRDIRTQETGAAVGAGFVVTVLVLAIFLAAMKWWEGRATLKPGENRDDAFEIPLLRLSAGLLWAGAVIVPIVNLQVDADRTSASWLLQPFFVVAGAYVTAFLAYSLVFAWTPAKKLEPLWSRRSRSLWGSYLAITLYGTAFALLFAVLPAASYAAHAVGLKGVLAPVGSLLAGRLLMTRAVAGNAERFEISKTVLRVLLAIVVAGLIGFTMVEVGALAIDEGFVDPLGPDGWWPYAVAVGVASIALAVLCYTVNLNRIGLHFFYRDRILETYLRSEVESTSTSGGMTPFVSTMEMKLQDVHGNGPAADGLGNTSPYLLVSAALNLAGSRDLTRKDRKSGYFLFSKYFCGSKQTRYRETKEYLDGRTQLARALTVSGAAAGTGMGYQTFFAQSFLSAIFNIRLGQWISNPRTNKKEKGFWPLYILREALGATNERTKLVNVSDGGHTGDNVGIYPLLERRCQVIIASDAEADPSIGFGSFTEALRHAYVDLGVDVDIDLSMITPDPHTGWSQSHCAIGRIRYPECPGRPNWIIYMKNSLTGNEPAPVLNYKRMCPAFPHESTADQFFDDAQFESYRALGDHIAEETFARWAGDPEVRTALGLRTRPLPERDCATVNRKMMSTLAWDELRIRHSPFRAADNQQFRELTQQLGELEQLFLETPELRWYYLECMGLAAPDPKADRQSAVNVIATQIQLMEDSYFALRLDRYSNARDNRGWMNLFRRWGRSPTFKEYFRKLKSNYSNSFVTFYCDYVEDWDEIDGFPVPHAWDVREATDKYEHPSARECRERGAPGIYQDGGRIEAGEPEEDGATTRPQDQAAPGEHGGAKSQTEARPSTPPSTPPESKE